MSRGMARIQASASICSFIALVEKNGTDLTKFRDDRGPAWHGDIAADQLCDEVLLREGAGACGKDRLIEFVR